MWKAIILSILAATVIVNAKKVRQGNIFKMNMTIHMWYWHFYLPWIMCVVLMISNIDEHLMMTNISITYEIYNEKLMILCKLNYGGSV